MKRNRIFNSAAAVLFLVLSALASSAQVQTTQQQRELANYIKSHYTKHEVMIPMRDGVKLFTQIYEPKDTKQKYPMMFDRTCDSVAPYGPDKLRPNEPTKISYVMPGIVHTFKKGHRIMVQIQSTWFPLVARNPQKFMTNYKQSTDADFQKATERVYHSAAYPSRVVLPVWNR
ncbi:MAG: uncharacterized protein QOI77_1222 [Blastocatellia bacterium]|jgi:predicted acyl esterase|nr:uncharacterized protein [Blastocatellia bacterium]